MIFVPPPATSGSITANPGAVVNDGTSYSTITVTLQNSKGQGAEGKTIALSEGSGDAQITPTGATPGVTDSSGVATFQATDTQAETVTFTATDVTDGNLPVPGSAPVVFNGTGSTGCGIESVPTGENGAIVSVQATAFATGPGTGYSCAGAFGMAFDSNDNLYVSDQPSGKLYKFLPSERTADPGTLLASSLGPDIDDITFGTDGTLWAVQANTDTIFQVNPTTGAVVSSIPSPVYSPAWIATDPLSGDLFVTSGGESSGVWRIHDPERATPTDSEYASDSDGQGLNQITFAPNGTLYAVTYDNRLVSFSGTNTTSPTESTVANLPSGDAALALGPIGSNGVPTSVFTNSASGTITKTTVATDTMTAVAGSSGSIDFKVGPDGCLYPAVTNLVVKITDTNGLCDLTPSAGPPEVSLTGPGVASLPAGSPVTFTANLSNVSSPAGTPILFSVTGANPQVKLVDADASGSASFTYSALHPGADTVVATALIGTASSPTSNSISFTWATGKDTTFLSLNGSQEIGAVGQAATINASLVDISRNPPTAVANASVAVAIGAQSCTITTGPAGTGSCQITPSTDGLLSVMAAYAGSSTLTASLASSSFFAGGPSTTPPSIAPSFTSINSDNVPAGTAFTYSVTTTGSPTPAISLAPGSTTPPEGVTLTDNGDGTATLAGTSSVAPGVYTFTIQAANGVSPNATQPFTLTLTSPPSFTSADSDTVPAGTAFNFPVTTTGTPTPMVSLAAGATTPPGVTLTPNMTGGATLSGTSSVAADTYTFTLQAINGITPNATQPFTLTVTQNEPTISIKIKGFVNYSNSGSLTSGGFTVTPSSGTISSVQGMATIPGLKGGTATITVKVKSVPTPLGTFYLGTISVSDPDSHLNTTAIVLTKSLTRVGSLGASGTAIGLLYLMNWTV
jgi:hypothetical protein